MRIHMVTVLACAVAAMVTLHASASLQVLTSTGPVTPSQADVTYDPVTDGWDITLKALYEPGGESLYRIIGNGGETINELIIDVPCWEGPNGDCVPAGSPVIVRVISQAPDGIHTIHNIQQTGDAETILAEVHTTHDIGSIEVEAMGIVRAERDIHGPVVATTEDNPARGITVLEAERDLLADVSAPQGKAHFIHGLRQIGTPDDPITIEAKYNVLSVFGSQGIYADVHAGANGGAGFTWSLKGAVFQGSLTTGGLGSIPQQPDIPGHIEITDSFNATVILKGEFPDNGQWIRLPAGGFAGQFIFNYTNQTSQWTGPVKLGDDDSPDQIVLDSPGYTFTPDQLGGGSIGLVPFALHDEACVPTNGATGTLEGVDEPLAVRLRHYGPVVAAGSAPVFVERRPNNSSDAYEPVAQSLYTTLVAPDDPNTIVVLPATKQPVFVEGYDYRISATTALQCDVPSLTPVQWDEPYIITITESSSCPADLDGDNTVGIGDLLLMLDAWGPADDTEPADIVDNGAVDMADLLELLANWGRCSDGDGGDGGPIIVPKPG